jgi:hypothetical protein
MPHPANFAMTATNTANSVAAATAHIPPVPEANNTVLLWQYLGTVSGWTLVVIVALLWAYWQLKKNPAFLNKLKSMLGVPVSHMSQHESRSLVVEETIQLDADKLLHLVRCEGEKFLMSNGPDGLKLLTKVATSWQEAMQHLQQEEQQAGGATGHAQSPTHSGVTERTQAMVDVHGDVHLTNTPHSVAQVQSAGVSFPMGVPKTLLGQNVPWFTNR